MPFGFQFAKSQAIAIAADRVAHIDADNKAALLAQIDKTFEEWKLEQADVDGMIAFDPLMFGLLGQPLNGVSLGDLIPAKTGERKFAPVQKLLPEQCAGPFVRCRADLFVKLWGEKYPPILGITNGPGASLDIILALLVEKYGESMPVDSLANALRYIWIAVWSTTKAFRETLSEQDAEIGMVRAALAATEPQRAAWGELQRARSFGGETRGRQRREDAELDYKAIRDRATRILASHEPREVSGIICNQTGFSRKKVLKALAEHPSGFWGKK